jgi:hypothetical protein
VNVADATVGVTSLGLQLVQVRQPPLDADVVGRVDHGLDPQRPPVLQILRDAGMLPERVDADLDAAGDDPRVEPVL